MRPENVTCWGVVCGLHGLAVIDFDWPWVYRRWRSHFGERAETWTVSTPNGGVHVYFLIAKPVTNDRFKRTLHTEIKGPGRFVVYAGKARREDGSIGEYKIRVDKPILTDDAIVTDALAFLQETERRYHFLRWNCLRPLLSMKVFAKPSYDLRLVLSDIMAYEDFAQDEIHNFFHDFPDFDQAETGYQVKYTADRVREGLKPFKCETLREKLGWREQNCEGCPRRSSTERGDAIPAGSFAIRQVGPNVVLEDSSGRPTWSAPSRELQKSDVRKELSNRLTIPIRELDVAAATIAAKWSPESEEQKLQVQIRVSGIAIEGRFEAIYHEGKPAFLVWNGSGFKILNEVHEGDVVIKPPTKDGCPYPPYRFYSGEVEVEQLSRLIYAEYEAFIDAEDSHKQRWTVETFLTYQQEKIRKTPYELLVGVGEAGKTQTLYLMSLLMYRPLYGTSFPPADIYSYLATHQPGTILEDEIQGIERDPDKLKIYNTGYKQGATVPRIFISPNGDRVIKYFPTYGFKAAASRNLVDDGAFLERVIISHMMEGWPTKDEFLKEDVERLLALRDRLLKWRMLNSDQELSDVDPLVVGRLKELWKPLLQVGAAIGLAEQMKQAVAAEYKSRRQEKEASLEASILRAVMSCIHEHGEEWISVASIWDALTAQLDGQSNSQDPSKFYSDEYGDITKRLLGYRLREVLGAEKKDVRHEGKVRKCYRFAGKKLAKAVKRYICSQVAKFTLVLEGKGHHIEFSCPYFSTVEASSQICTNETVAPEGMCKLGNLATILAPKRSSLPVRGSPEESEHDRVVRKLRNIAQAPDLSYFEDQAVDMLGDSEKARILVKGLVDGGQLAPSPDGPWRWTRG
jgi:hypothetical protein